MPVDFLPRDQFAGYSRYAEQPSAVQSAGDARSPRAGDIQPADRRHASRRAADIEVQVIPHQEQIVAKLLQVGVARR